MLNHESPKRFGLVKVTGFCAWIVQANLRVTKAKKSAKLLRVAGKHLQLPLGAEHHYRSLVRGKSICQPQCINVTASTSAEREKLFVGSRIVLEPALQVIHTDLRKLEATTNRVSIAFEKGAKINNGARQAVSLRKCCFDVCGRHADGPNAPSSAPRRTGRMDCNQSAMAGFAAGQGWALWSLRLAGWQRIWWVRCAVLVVAK